jgi:uncharacterized protein YjfI (DUF2170 family)
VAITDKTAIVFELFNAIHKKVNTQEFKDYLILSQRLSLNSQIGLNLQFDKQLACFFVVGPNPFFFQIRFLRTPPNN